ncbi:MAG TPA: hypothetical protein VMD53_10275 [Rhizomicrobium sp.]|nr:hypothetical protein [Rhizomicrobium sp.]
MKTRRLGKSGPLVSALGLGCMGMYGSADEGESIAGEGRLRQAHEHGQRDQRSMKHGSLYCQS